MPKPSAGGWETLLRETDLKPLYDRHRALFYIGLDPEPGKASHSYYDLLMSESRMTGYYAIASRIVPKNTGVRSAGC